MKDNTRRGFIKNIAVAVPGIGGAVLGSGYIPVNQEKQTNEASKEEGFQPEPLRYDLVVYGGTSSGVMAAYTAKRYGLSVLLVEPGRHVGGLTSGGLGATDTGGKAEAITGLSKEFYLRVGYYYGEDKPMYRFEPHVAEGIFNQYLNEADVEVLYSRRVRSVDVKNSKIAGVEFERSSDDTGIIYISAGNFIDATYEGDLMARAGVSYTVGRESNSEYGEKFNGVLPSRVAGSYHGPVKRTREWSVDIDPYVIPGKPDSGLLPEINGIGHKPIGEGDKSVQSYCFRLCLTQDRKNQIPLSQPESYDPDRYELLARLLKKEPWEKLGGVGFIISEMPNGKTDWNNYGLVGFSSNYTGKSHDYPDAGYHERARIWNDHIAYQKGLLWFLSTDSRVPPNIRHEMNTWGYCRDEFLDTGGWPHQLYIREARRMVSDFVMTEHECVGSKPVKDGIAYGAYALDSHTCQRVVVDDHVENEGNFFIKGFDPYLISYRSIVPKREEISNLLVPVCVSASHASYGSLRMEPVFMGIGQAAGIAAYLATKNDREVQDVDPEEIRKELTENPLVNRKIPREHSTILPFRPL